MIFLKKFRELIEYFLYIYCISCNLYKKIDIKNQNIYYYYLKKTQIKLRSDHIKKNISKS